MSASNPKKAHSGKGPASRFYVFSVVTMAVLLAMLAWRHPRGTEFVVEANMRYARQDTASGEPVRDPEEVGAIAEGMRSEGAIQFTLASMDEDWVKQMIPRTHGETSAGIVAECLFVRVEPDADAANHEIKVRYIGGPREFALKMVEKLTANFAGQHNNAAAVDSASKRLADAGVEAERAGTRIQELEAELDNYVTAELDVARSKHESEQHNLQLAQRSPKKPQSAARSTVQPETVPSPETAAQPETVPDQQPETTIQMPVVELLNPAWANLNDKLSDSEQHLSQLLLRKTHAHPDVQRTEVLVAELRQQLAETAQFIDHREPIESPGHTLITNDTLPSDVSTDAGPARETQTEVAILEPEPGARAEDAVAANDVEPEGIEVVPVDLAPPVVAFDAQAEQDRILDSAVGSRLRQQIAAAQRDHELQLTELGALEEQQSAFRESTLLVGHPRIVRHYTNELRKSTLWSFLGIGSVAGLFVAMMRKKPATPETIYSVGVAEKTLQTRALGTITTNDGPLVIRPESPALPIWVRPLVRAAEVTLFVSAAAVMFAAVSVPEFGSQFIENPFAAFAVAVDHVSSLVS